MNVDFEEKMDQTHRSLLCRMLNVKELPEYLLEEYLKVKTMTDRIDGRLSPGNLAIIAMMAGFDPDTGKFCVTLGETIKKPVLVSKEGDYSRKFGENSISLMKSDDKVIEEAVEPPVEQVEKAGKITASELKVPAGTITSSKIEVNQISGATGQEATVKAAEKPIPEKGKTMLWSPGMPVNVLQEEELKQGKIFAVHPGEPVQLTVSLDGGENVMVNEDEVEAI